LAITIYFDIFIAKFGKMNKLIGREKEAAFLKNLTQSKKSEFVIIYGRRRVGKTYLIRQVLGNQFTFYYTGVYHVKQAQHLANFHASLVKYSNGLDNIAPLNNWFEAFEALTRIVEKSKGEKKVIFIDELPWLDTATSNFVPALEYFWNSWASNRNDVLLIACGSAASWMTNKLINNKGGLHNRVTQRIKLDPFTLNECENFFKEKNGVFDRYQLVQLFMAFGGIPFYLDQVDVSLSAAQNINNLCFTKTGLLQNEFNNLYASLFKKAEKHVTVIEALATKLKGLSRDELITKSKLPNSGNTTKLLKELEESDFIRKYNSFGKTQRNMMYQLTDFYSLFYLRFIKSNNAINEDFWLNSIDSQAVKAWSGYAYEQVCLWHLSAIKKALGISGIQTKSSAWLATSPDKKAQIDLVIDRKDHVINICEMKFSMESFSITKQYADEIKKKIAAFKTETKTRKAIYFTMITSFGLEQNSYATSLVQKELTMDALFT
jgi:hypothetical protein